MQHYLPLATAELTFWTFLQKVGLILELRVFFTNRKVILTDTSTHQLRKFDLFVSFLKIVWGNIDNLETVLTKKIATRIAQRVARKKLRTPKAPRNTSNLPLFVPKVRKKF